MSILFTQRVCQELDQLKAFDVKTYDVQSWSSVTDIMTVATADSLLQIEAIRSRVARLAKKESIPLLNAAEPFQGGWLVMDFGAMVLHVFLPELRHLYNLDGFLESQSLLQDAQQPSLA